MIGAEAKSIAVVGAGLMGHGIAQVFAQNGFHVIICDVNDRILETALENIKRNLLTFVEAGLEDVTKINAILDRVRTKVRIEEAVSNSDFIIEAAPEDMELKRRLFAEIDRHCPKHAIIASNTSMLPISEFGSDVTRKEKLIITHWFNPPHIIPVIEVVRSRYTSDDTTMDTMSLLKRIGKSPIKIEREIQGFFINRIQTAMFREVLSLLEEGIVSVEDCDRAIKGSFGLRLGVIGVLETMDMAGLDLMYKGAKHLYRLIESSVEPQDILKMKVESGELGIKSGKGFYSYSVGTDNVVSITRERDLKLLRILKTLSY